MIILSYIEGDAYLFSFSGSVVWEKLTGQITKPGVLTAVSKIIARIASGRSQSWLPGATKCLQRLEFVVF